MSTATANYISSPLTDMMPGTMGRATFVPVRDRGHLRLVPGSGRASIAQDEGVRASTVAAKKQGTLQLRITRRGRLAVTGTVALALAVVGLSLLTVLGPAGATSSIVVQPGTTLSQVATEHLPDVPLSRAVTDIQRANSLSTTSIAAGQELVIPGR